MNHGSRMIFWELTSSFVYVIDAIWGHIPDTPDGPDGFSQTSNIVEETKGKRECFTFPRSLSVQFSSVQSLSCDAEMLYRSCEAMEMIPI